MYYILLFSWIVFLVITNLVWIRLDAVPPWWDQSWYLQYSHMFYHALQDQGIGELIRQFSHAFQIKAPLISLLPLPLYFIFGSSHDAALYVNIVFLVVFNIFLFLLVLELRKNYLAALLSAIILGTMPLVYGVSRQFLVEYSLMTFAAVWVYLLLKSEWYTKFSYNLLLGIIGGLGMLLKVTFPLYIAAPSVIALWMRLRREKTNAIRDIGLVLLLVTLISSIWYVNNFKNVFNFLWSASVGSASRDYSIGSVFSFKTIKIYFEAIINHGISVYYFLILIFCAFVVLYKRFWAKDYGWLLPWFVLPLIVFTFSVNKDFRFIMPALPALGIFLAFLLTDLIPKRFYAVFTVLLVFPVYSYLYSSFDVFPKKDVIVAGYPLLLREHPYTFPPKKENWPIEPIIAFIEEDSSAVKQRPMMAAVLISIPYFNHNNFNYYAEAGRSRILFAGVPQDDQAVTEELLKMSQYIITKEGGDQGPLFVNRFNAYFKDQLKNGGLPFEKIAEFFLPDGSLSFIYKRFSSL